MMKSLIINKLKKPIGPCPICFEKHYMLELVMSIVRIFRSNHVISTYEIVELCLEKY